MISLSKALVTLYVVLLSLNQNSNYLSYSRYEELGKYIQKLDRHAEKSLSCIRRYNHPTGFIPSCLRKPLGILCEYFYMKMNFDKHHEIRQQQLEETIVFMDEIEDVEELKNHFEFLTWR